MNFVILDLILALKSSLSLSLLTSICCYSLNNITCTLWGTYVVEFVVGFNIRDPSFPYIVILKHAKIKEPQGTIILVYFIQTLIHLVINTKHILTLFIF